MNHTQVSNNFIDQYMKEINGADVKVFLAICRKTIGWHKETDAISLTQLEKITGLARRHVVRAVGELVKKDIIMVIQEPGKTNKYSVNYQTSDERELELVTKGNRTSDKREPELVTKGNTQKKDKETLQKKEPCGQAVTLANAFFSLIKEKVDPPCYRKRTPDLSKWALEIEKIHAKDGQPWNEIEMVINAVVEDPFWSIIVLTGSKLREKYNTLYLNLKKNKKTAKSVKELYGDRYVHNNENIR